MSIYKRCYFCEEYALERSLVKVMADTDIVNIKDNQPVLKEVGVCSLCKEFADKRSK